MDTLDKKRITHEQNIVSIAKRVIEKFPSINLNFPEESSEIHISRKTLIDSIKKKMLDYLQRYVESPDYLTSIRWFYTQKLLDFHPQDPLIPFNTDDNESLYFELEKIRVPPKEIRELSEIIHRMIQKFNKNFI